MNYLKIELNAPIMYFNDQSNICYTERSDRYTTCAPTLATIIGILGCGLGYKRDSKEMNQLCEQIFDCKYIVIKPGYVFRDFKRIERYRNTHFKEVKTGKENNKESLIRNVYLVGDARFHVFIGSTDENIDRFYDALANPYWTTYIGKYECVPTSPIVTRTKEIVSEEELKDAFTCL